MNTNAEFVDTLLAQSQETLLEKRGWLRLALVFFGLGAVAFLLSETVRTDQWWVHGAWCLCGLVIVTPILVRVFRSRFGAVLSDHLVMFTAAFALYFLFGALFLWLGDEEGVVRNLRYYPTDTRAALLADSVNSIGFGLALLAAALSSGRWLGAQASRLAILARGVPAPMAMALLMVVGVLAWANVLLADFAISSGIIDGIWRLAANFILVAILLSSSYHGKHETVIRLIAIVVTVVQAFVGILLFNKSSVVLPLGALVAGLSMRYGARKILLPGLMLIGFVLLSITDVVGYGRNHLDLQSGAPIPLSERVAVLKEGFAASIVDDDSSQGSTWGRLCYTVPQVAAMDLYGNGRGGNEIRLIPWAFVPRMLAPNKPIITRGGGELHQKITGNSGSSTGTGIFVSGYYNAGWPGVLFASLLSGWLLAQTSAISHAVLARRAFILLPLVMLGVFMAFRIDGDFVSDYIGAFMFILYPLLASAMLLSIRGRRG